MKSFGNPIKNTSSKANASCFINPSLKTKTNISSNIAQRKLNDIVNGSPKMTIHKTKLANIFGVSAIPVAQRVTHILSVGVDSCLLTCDDLGILNNTDRLAKQEYNKDNNSTCIPVELADLSQLTSNDTIVLQGHGNETHMGQYDVDAMKTLLKSRGLTSIGTITSYGCETSKFCQALITKLSFSDVTVKNGLASTELIIIDNQGRAMTLKKSVGDQIRLLKQTQGYNSSASSPERKLVEQLEGDIKNYVYSNQPGSSFQTHTPDLIDFS